MSKKKIIIFVVVGSILLILFLAVLFFALQISESNGCLKRCRELGYKFGVCTAGGSGTGSGCDKMGGITISSSDNPIPGCDFVSIGSWEECCCF